MQGKERIIAASRQRAGRRYGESVLPESLNLPPPIVPVTDLPQRLRLETRDLHLLSERSGVMAELLDGRLTRGGYLALLRNLHAIYVALEAGLARHPDEPALVALAAAPLHRASALAADLVALGGTDGGPDVPLAASTQAYARRLQALADSDPLLLAAHAYVRYLGDLHGGQALKRLVERSLLAEGGAQHRGATQFYDFGSPAQVLVLREGFRAGLARIEVSAAAANRLVAEARRAFELHIALFNELAAAAQPAV